MSDIAAGGDPSLFGASTPAVSGMDAPSFMVSRIAAIKAASSRPGPSRQEVRAARVALLRRLIADDPDGFVKARLDLALERLLASNVETPSRPSSASAAPARPAVA